MIIDDLFFAKFRALIKTAPQIIRDLLAENADLRERLDFHPELNTLEHIRIVTFRAMAIDSLKQALPDDIGTTNLIFSGILHDIGKKRCAKINPKTHKPTSPGHDKFAADLINQNIAIQAWILQWGADPHTVAWICQQHMRIKRISQMRQTKRTAIENHPNYIELVIFSLLDNMLEDF